MKRLPLFGSLKNSMLNKMGHTLLIRLLVTGTAIDNNSALSHRRINILVYDFDTVGKD
jgi:hypothetical protein